MSFDQHKQYMSFLKSFSMFRDFHSKELLLLAQHLTERKFDTNQIVCRENDNGESCYFILAGSVAVVKVLDNDETELLAKLERGRMFGQISLLDGKPRSATCVAMEPLILLELAKSDFDRMFEMCESFAFRFQNYLTGVMARQMLSAQKKLADLVNSIENMQQNDEASLKRDVHDAYISANGHSMTMSFELQDERDDFLEKKDKLKELLEDELKRLSRMPLDEDAEFIDLQMK